MGIKLLLEDIVGLRNNLNMLDIIRRGLWLLRKFFNKYLMGCI